MPRVTRLPNCQHVMGEATQFHDDRIIEILIGVKRGHEMSGLLVFSNGPLNFLSVLMVIFPGRFQIGGG